MKTKENTECEIKCPWHGNLSIRGRHFKGFIKKIIGQRAVIEWERVVFYPKYERYSRIRSKAHAHIPKCLTKEIKVGDYVEIGECRRLSKINHFVVLEKKKAVGEKEER